MTARVTWRPPWYAWVLVGLVGLGAIHYKEPSLLHGYRVVLAVLLVVAAVLVLRRLWELPPAVIVCAAVALSIFSGGWNRMGLGGLALDRLAVLLVVLAFLLRAPGLANTPRLQVRNVHLLLALLLMYVLGSAMVSGTLTSELGGLSLFDQVGVVPFLMFLIAPAVFAGKRERNMLLATLVGVGAYLGFTAIFESLGPHALIFPHYILTADAEAPEARAGGPFQSSVAEGFATFACATAAVIAFSQWRGTRARCLAAVVAVACAIGCFLTLERGVWIAAVVATVVTALTMRVGRRWLLPGAAACALLIGCALLVSPALSNKVSTRVNDNTSLWSRETQTTAGLKMIQARPLFGFGWRQFTSAQIEYFRQANDYPMLGYSTSEELQPLHDTYLSYAVELGLVGASLWFVALLWGAGGAVFSKGPPDLHPWKRGLLAVTVFYLVVSLFNPYMASFPMLLFWMWAGVAMGRITPASWRPRPATIAALPSGDPAWASA
jgi:putative inorganic carbon (hco3(-)) transporter